jgi:Tfp pilus assembly protein PilZ
MKARERRQERRVALSRRATLQDGDKTYAGLLQDFSSRGFFIITNEKFHIGQTLELSCELYPAQVLKCTLQVKHISETCIGTKITNITPDGKTLLEKFLQEYYSLKLNQST